MVTLWGRLRPVLRNCWRGFGLQAHTGTYPAEACTRVGGPILSSLDMSAKSATAQSRTARQLHVAECSWAPPSSLPRAMAAFWEVQSSLSGGVRETVEPFSLPMFETSRRCIPVSASTKLETAVGIQ